MVRLEFQENTKMLTVPTKYCRNITRTSLCNSRNSFRKMFFPVKKLVPRFMVRLEFQENTKMLTVPTNNIFDQKYFRNITRTSLCNSRNSFGKMFFPVKK